MIVVLALVGTALALTGCPWNGEDVNALTKAKDSARLLGEEIGIPIIEAREDYCGLLGSYETDGPYGSFLTWALNELDLYGSSRSNAEGAVFDLEEAIQRAEENEELEKLIKGVWGP